jgi:histidinol-phosphate aminotransferase
VTVPIQHPPWLDEVVPYTPGKSVDELERRLGHRAFVKLASNENPLGPGPAVLKAIAETAGSLATYPDAGTFELRHRLGARLGVDPGHVILGAGSTDLINILVRTRCTHWDNIVISQFGFLAYELAATASGVPFTKVPCGPGMTQDLPALAAACDLQTRLLFLANPNNPTGRHATHDELAAFLRAVPEHVTVVLDEAYVEYVDDPAFPDALALRGERPDLVILRTFSKAFAIAGLRVGYAVAPPSMVSLFDRVRQPFHVNTLGQAAALAALDDVEHLRRSVDLVRVERARLLVELGRLGLEPLPSQGNFLLVRAPLGGLATFEAMMELGVILRPVTPYGLPDHVRVTVGAHDENTRMLEAFSTLLTR